ncbi:MAG: glycosyltransferase family 4 protein [Pseudomonadota bacterium]
MSAQPASATATRQRPRVLAVASHPIQYQAPWFRALAAEPSIDFSVLFVQLPDPAQQGRGFGVAFTWDVPLLEGYRWRKAPHLRGRGGLHGFLAARIAHPLALLRELDPDVLMLTGWHIWPLVQMLISARRLGIPVVMRGESNALRKRPWHARALHRMILGACAAFLPIGRASRAFYRGYGIAGEQLFDTPYFVDNARFAVAAAAARPQRTALRERWAIPPQATCFCYAGKLEPKKRILDLLEALRIAAGENAALHLLVVGTGELMAQAQDMVSRHGLPVTFAGFLNQTEIPAAYVAADCLVLPSDFGETWGLVVNEAMACGRPAIVSDRVGCASDLVTDGVTGFVFPFGDTTALAQRLLSIAADTPTATAMGEEARRRVEAGYTIGHSVRGTLQAVEWTLAR